MKDIDKKMLVTLFDGAVPKNPLSSRILAKVKKLQAKAQDVATQRKAMADRIVAADEELVRLEGAVREYLEDICELEVETEEPIRVVPEQLSS